MIRVAIELIPFGTGTPKLLKEFFIANDGQGNELRGNYKVRWSKTKPWIERVVVNYPRTSYPVQKLVYLVLRSLYAK